MLGKKSFPSKAIVWKHRHTEWHKQEPTALPGPLEWSA